VPSRSDTVVFVGLFANAAIAVGKYVAGGVTGSPAMMSEAFHSTADVGNELLLLLGMRRSHRPPARFIPLATASFFIFIRCWWRFTFSESAVASPSMKAFITFGILNLQLM
jgi:Co/Zn/Cd efflux system component